MSVTVFVPQRTSGQRSPQFRSKIDAFRRSNRVYVCIDCGRWHNTKVTHCAGCERPAIQHFASTSEARRYAHLKLLRDNGVIERLELQPRFPVEIHGVKLCTYVADFRYVDKHGTTIVEDCKGNADYQDNASKLRRKAAELYYGFEVKIITNGA